MSETPVPELVRTPDATIVSFTGPDASPRIERRRGRNETCWCGSGRKYKVCHLDADQQRTGMPISEALVRVALPWLGGSATEAQKVAAILYFAARGWNLARMAEESRNRNTEEWSLEIQGRTGMDRAQARHFLDLFAENSASDFGHDDRLIGEVRVRPRPDGSVDVVADALTLPEG